MNSARRTHIGSLSPSSLRTSECPTDGRRAAATIKELSLATPVILLTGWGQQIVDEGESLPNVDILLSKPPKLCELREALARCLPVTIAN
jgi:hypothetical protein